MVGLGDSSIHKTPGFFLFLFGYLDNIQCQNHKRCILNVKLVELGWVASSAGASCYFCIWQEPAVLAAGAGRVGYIFYLPFLMFCLLGDG